MINEDKKEYFFFIDRLFSEAIEPKVFLISLIEYMRITLMMKVGIEDTKILEISESEMTDILPFVTHYNPTELERILEYILNVEEKVRYASQPRIIFQMRLIFLLDLSNIIKPVDIISVSTQNKPLENPNQNNNKENMILKPALVSDRVKPANTDDKKTVFYKRILSFIANESNTIYSLLSQGKPKYSEGTVLFVELPENIYDMINTDKRGADLVQKALQANSTNANVRIEFIKATDSGGDVIEKFKNTFDAKTIDTHIDDNSNN